MSADQRRIFSFDNPKLRHGQTMNSGEGNNQMKLLHGVPKGHIRLQQQQMAGVRAGHNIQSNGMLIPVADQRGPSMQQQSMLSSSVSKRSGLIDVVAVRNSVPETSRVLPATHTVFTTFPSKLPPLNSFPLASAPGMLVSYQEEVNSLDTKGCSSAAAAMVTTAGFGNPSYDLFNDFPQQQHYNNNNNSNRLNDWDLRNIRMVFNSHQDTSAAAAFSFSEAYFSPSTHKRKREAELMAEYGQQPPSRSVNHMNGGSVRVKTETLTSPPATTMFHEQYSHQEDLMSALLKQEGHPSIDNEFDFGGYSMDDIQV